MWQHIKVKLSKMRLKNLPIKMLQDSLINQMPELLNTILIIHFLHCIYIILISFQTMLVQASKPSNEQVDSALSKIKQVFTKLTWKHAIFVSIPICIYIYPKPIMRLLMPIASKFSNNHPNVICNQHLQQIILTTNEQITFQTLSKINILKGTSPHLQNYHQHQRIIIELLPADKKTNLFASYSVAQAQLANQQTNNLYSQTLWNNFRLTKIENPNMKVMLIKSSQFILMQFLLKFYKISKSQSHKIGFLSDKKLIILRLDRRVGTYEHLSCEFQQF